MVTMNTHKVLVTGASGFVGAALLRALHARGMNALGVVRSDKPMAHCVAGPNLSANANWSHVLTNCTAVVHAAARGPSMPDQVQGALAAYRATNVDGTLVLARQALQAGVRRFVFISSIKVNGESTQPGFAFTALSDARPCGAYAQTKHEAELALRALVAGTAMELVIVRPPLVYGPSVNGNFAWLMGAVMRGLPLPLGSITHNRRSLLALDNLTDYLIACLLEESAAGQTLLVSDQHDLSTAELIQRIGQALGKPARLVPVPASWLQLLARMSNRSEVMDRLCGSLQVDMQANRALQHWQPPLGVDAALQRLRNEHAA